MHVHVHRTWGHLLYVNRATLDHFKMVSKAYNDVTHRDGRVWIQHSMVLRQITNQLLDSSISRMQFQKYINLPDDTHLDKVYRKYLIRIETMMGKEVVRQATEALKRKGESRLESLRDIKKQKRNIVKKI